MLCACRFIGKSGDHDQQVLLGARDTGLPFPCREVHQKDRPRLKWPYGAIARFDFSLAGDVDG